MLSPVQTIHRVRLLPYQSSFANGSICSLPSLANPPNASWPPSRLCRTCETRSPPHPPAPILQQLWLSLGGDRCVDATGRTNLDLFWKLLDRLPGGEQDLTGPSLDAALEELFALPDPATSSECGVQLMTIHKSKGLEFEVVLVPDLHVRGGNNKPELLSWLERGIAEPEESDDLTEFLVAPLQFKGDDRGKARQWVDRIRRERESQETRRILYVAATRAREELHFFAQPAYKIEDDGSRSLQEPRNCLLATAWPALGDEIRARFDQWNNSSQASTANKDQVIDTIAAAGQNNLYHHSPTRATDFLAPPSTRIPS